MRTSSVFLNLLPPYLLETGSLGEPGVHQLPGLAGLPAPGAGLYLVSSLSDGIIGTC